MPVKAAFTAAALILAAAPAGARGPVLRLPVDCSPGADCYIQNYVDRDPGPGVADPGCGPLSYDGHDGTDFALPDLAAMAAGVAVVAAAPGTVRAARDGMADHSQDAPDAPDVTGRECGNGVVIDHGGGWETQYCHLKSGSVAVSPGRRVGAGWKLGEIGLSGQSEFPHLHFTLRQDGRAVDPFGPESEGQCGSPGQGLWQNGQPAWVPAGLISAGISGTAPDFAEVKAGTANAGQLAGGEALVIWGNVFGPLPGDLLEFRLLGPEGFAFGHSAAFERPQAMAFRYAGRPAGPHPAGHYSGTVRLLRGGVELDRRTVSVEVLP